MCKKANASNKKRTASTGREGGRVGVATAKGWIACSGGYVECDLDIGRGSSTSAGWALRMSMTGNTGLAVYQGTVVGWWEEGGIRSTPRVEAGGGDNESVWVVEGSLWTEQGWLVGSD